MKAIFVGSLAQGILPTQIVEDSTEQKTSLLPNGAYQEVVTLRDPSERRGVQAGHVADPAGKFVVAFGHVGTFLHFYGPFADFVSADDFGDKASCGDDYSIFNVRA